MQVGLTLSVMRQTLLHFNKVPLPISALLCKKPEATIFYLHKSSETQQDQMWSKAPSSTWHTVNIHAAPLKSSLHPPHLMPRQLPGHCSALPTAGQGSLEQASAHTRPSALHKSKWEIKALQWWKLVQWFLPSETFKFFYKRSQVWWRKAGGFLHTEMLMLLGPVTLPSHCSTSKAQAPSTVCTSNPANTKWALSVSTNGAAAISSQLPHSSRPSQKQVSCLLLFLWNVLTSLRNESHFRPYFHLSIVFPLSYKGTIKPVVAGMGDHKIQHKDKQLALKLNGAGQHWLAGGINSALTIAGSWLSWAQLNFLWSKISSVNFLSIWLSLGVLLKQTYDSL